MAKSNTMKTNKEAIAAVEWLERRYDNVPWRDGYDARIFLSGSGLSVHAQDMIRIKDDNPPHYRSPDTGEELCGCYNMPGQITSAPWTEEDDAEWLTGEYLGRLEVFRHARETAAAHAAAHSYKNDLNWEEW